MDKKLNPMNISLLIAKPEIFRTLGEVKSRDIFEQNSTEFHREGLFSSVIFGPPGSKERMTRFGYISTGLPVLHPRIYKEVCSLSSLYKGILEGTKYATWNAKEKDFIESDPVDGETGFRFFMKHYDEIEFKETDSIRRKFKILFCKKYKAQEVILDKYLVIPAGLRDYIITESGKPLEDEINNYYRKILSAASTGRQFKSETRDNELLNTVRRRIQNAVNTVYDHIENLLDGKGGFIQDKWTKRSIMYGTRNVLTSMPKEMKDLKDPDKQDALMIGVGIFQAAKGLLPITTFQLRTRYLHDIFDPESTKAQLIDPKTLNRIYINISEKSRSNWVTDDGLENTINKLIQDDIKNSPIVIDNHYLLLVYDSEDEVLILPDIDLLPDGYDRKKVRPITYGELIYISLFDIIKNYPGYVTRYPITGLGSINPGIPYLKSTVKSKKVKIKIPMLGLERETNEYPIIGLKWIQSISVPQIFLDRMGADYDGFREF